MPRQKEVEEEEEEEGLVLGSRKRGCSPSSSSSSLLHNYRFKRAIVVGKAARGSKSSTPAPSWGTKAADSPKFSALIGGRTSGPISARKLAATLWEMNQVPSPTVKREMKGRERMGSLPPHLSDPSHTPVSERSERSGSGSHHKRNSTVSHRLRAADKSSDILDSHSSVNLMEVETKSRGQTPTGHGVSLRTRLKDVSSALTTSKELLKIINRIWGRNDQPSSSSSLISALHSELERARFQVNQVINEHRSEQNEITHIIKCFSEEKASWKNKEKRAIESAIESVASELEIERKLRRRSESLNKKLGNELSETKESLMKTVKELEREKRASEILQQVCDDLAEDINENKSEMRVSEKNHQDVEKEREVLHLANILREERVQMKLPEAKNQHEEKNLAVNKLKNQLESLMRVKRGKEKGNNSLSRKHFSSHHSEDDGEVENGVVSEGNSDESDLHSIELNMENTKNSYNRIRFLGPASKNSRFSVDNEIRARNSSSGRPPRKSTPLPRSMSDGVEWAEQSERIRKLDERIDNERLYEIEKQNLVKSLLGRVSSSSRAGSVKDLSSPIRDRPTTGHKNNLTSRLVEEIRRSRQ